jgi:hypothetical protein
MEVIYCWEIWYNDVFLGYEYAVDGAGAVSASLTRGGVASQYGATVNELQARKL